MTRNLLECSREAPKNYVQAETIEVNIVSIQTDALVAELHPLLKQKGCGENARGSAGDLNRNFPAGGHRHALCRAPSPPRSDRRCAQYRADASTDADLWFQKWCNPLTPHGRADANAIGAEPLLWRHRRAQHDDSGGRRT